MGRHLQRSRDTLKRRSTEGPRLLSTPLIPLSPGCSAENLQAQSYKGLLSPYLLESWHQKRLGTSSHSTATKFKVRTIPSVLNHSCPLHLCGLSKSSKPLGTIMTVSPSERTRHTPCSLREGEQAVPCCPLVCDGGKLQAVPLSAVWNTVLHSESQWLLAHAWQGTSADPWEGCYQLSWHLPRIA